MAGWKLQLQKKNLPSFNYFDRCYDGVKPQRPEAHFIQIFLIIERPTHDDALGKQDLGLSLEGLEPSGETTLEKAHLPAHGPQPFGLGLGVGFLLF